MDLIYNLRISNRSKYIDIVHYYLSNFIEEGKLVVIHIPGKQNLVDIYTKGMPELHFSYLNDKIMYLTL